MVARVRDPGTLKATPRRALRQLTNGLRIPPPSWEIRKGIERTHGIALRKKTALTVDLLKDVLHRLDDSLRGRRDRALLLLAFADGFPRSEVAALDVADVRFEKRGAVVTLRRSKTDQLTGCD